MGLLGLPCSMVRSDGSSSQVPVVPSGGYSCPFDNGSHYEVQFSYANGDRTTLYVARHGCQFVGLDDNSGTAHAWSMTDSRLLNDLDALFR